MNRYFLLFSFFLSFGLLADTLDRNHFLYPRDKTALQITGIESLSSYSRTLDFIKNCPGDWPREKLVCQYFKNFRYSKNYIPNRDFFWSEDTNIIFFGERHIDQQGQYFLAERLSDLKADGFDSLALEMFNSADQKTLDQFNNQLIGINKLEKVLTNSWGYLPKGYLSLFESAQRNGINLIGIDSRDSLENLSFSQSLIRRDLHMAKTLKSYLQKDVQRKLIVLTGRLHAYKTLSRKDKVLTVSQLLSKEFPSLQFENYFFLGSREKTSFTAMMDEIRKDPQVPILIKPKELLPYIDGLIRF